MKTYVLEKKVTGKIKTHFVCEDLAFYEIMWKIRNNTQGIDGNITRSLRVECWVTETTDKELFPLKHPSVSQNNKDKCAFMKINI